MDLRRGPRAVIDPKVRQVGFITPAAAPPSVAASPSTDLGSAGSISPVMIPPPRHVASVDPSAPLTRHVSTELSVGSYNPSENLIGSPSIMSSSGRTDDLGSEFSDDVAGAGTGKFATSLPASGGGVVAVKATAENSSVVKTTEKERETLEIQNERSEDPKPKPKTSKAERRAIQEAQRAAKAAAKETGQKFSH